MLVAPPVPTVKMPGAPVDWPHWSAGKSALSTVGAAEGSTLSEVNADHPESGPVSAGASPVPEGTIFVAEALNS